MSLHLRTPLPSTYSPSYNMYPHVSYVILNVHNITVIQCRSLNAEWIYGIICGGRAVSLRQVKLSRYTLRVRPIKVYRPRSFQRKNTIVPHVIYYYSCTPESSTTEEDETLKKGEIDGNWQRRQITRNNHLNCLVLAIIKKGGSPLTIIYYYIEVYWSRVPSNAIYAQWQWD